MNMLKVSAAPNKQHRSDRPEAKHRGACLISGTSEQMCGPAGRLDVAWVLADAQALVDVGAANVQDCATRGRCLA